MSEKWIAFEGEGDENSRPATMAEWDEEFGLPLEQQREHDIVIREQLEKLGLQFSDWKPRLTEIGG